jgi:hypothetical protein
MNPGMNEIATIFYRKSNFTNIPNLVPTSVSLPHADPAAWRVIREFTSTDMSLPEAEKQVQGILGAQYRDADWQPAFKAVMDAEGDLSAATTTVEKLAQVAIRVTHTGLKIRILARQPASQLVAIENEVSKSISELKGCHCIIGESATLNQFLELSEEEEIGNSLSSEFEGLEGDSTIVAVVSREMAEQRGEVIEVESDDDTNDSEGSMELNISRLEGLELSRKFETACLQLADVTSPHLLDLISHIRHFRAHLQREELLHARQTTLDSFFTR